MVSNGTVRFKSGTINAWPAVKFYDANLVYGNGFGSSSTGESDAWGLWAFRYPVAFDGTKALSLPARGTNNRISLGYSSDSSEVVDDGLTYYHGRTELRVEDMTRDACVDVDIGMDVQSLPYWASGNNKATPTTATVVGSRRPVRVRSASAVASPARRRRRSRAARSSSTAFSPSSRAAGG